MWADGEYHTYHFIFPLSLWQSLRKKKLSGLELERLKCINQKGHSFDFLKYWQHNSEKLRYAAKGSKGANAMNALGKNTQ